MIFQLCSHSNTFLGSDGLYRVGDDKFLERNAVRQLQSTAPAYPVVCALLTHKVVQTLHIE